MRFFVGLAVLAAIVGQQQALATLSVETVPFLTLAGDDFDDPRYLTPVGTGYDGVAGLLINAGLGDALCTGALLEDGIHVLTAAHCVTDFNGNPSFISGSAYFFPSEDNAEILNIISASVHPDFNGILEAGNDLAILTLGAPASAAIQRYGIYRGTDEIGKTFDLTGFGNLGTGAIGETGPSGLRRHGLNDFDATMTGTLDVFPGWTGGDRVLFSDFDDGTAQHDAFGFFFGINGLGQGLDEVSTAGGDSGGPTFINGQIAGLTSFGIRVFTLDGATSDIDDFTNSSFGEINAFTRVSAYQDWIDSQVSAVPEPSTWTMVIMGGLLIGFASRRRRE